MTLVFPACILSYMGQGALILGDPTGGISSPFFQLGPDWVQIPMVLLATAATVIASQAVITGAYSVAHQAIQLGYLPRLRVQHTSDEAIGQIYVPWINWFLLVAVLSLVFAFGSSERLAFAYGMAVTGTITITTLLFLYYARQRWHRPMWQVVGGGAILLTVDLMFLAANLTKLFHGAWLPLTIGVLFFTVMVTWRRGREEVTARRQRFEGPLHEFVEAVNTRHPDLVRVRGTGVFLNRSADTTPLAMRACAERLHALHEHVVILTIETAPVPYMDPAENLTIDDLGYLDDGITRVGVRFGYMDQPNVPDVLRLVEKVGIECALEIDTASYFLSELELRTGHLPGMARWRKHLFVATSNISSDAAAYFGLPQERTITLGSQIEV
jgi:KUP system potassium uptake protein